MLISCGLAGSWDHLGPVGPLLKHIHTQKFFVAFPSHFQPQLPAFTMLQKSFGWYLLKSGPSGPTGPIDYESGLNTAFQKAKNGTTNFWEWSHWSQKWAQK